MCNRDEKLFLDDVLHNALSEVSFRTAAFFANHGIVPFTQDIAEILQAFFKPRVYSPLASLARRCAHRISKPRLYKFGTAF